MPRLLPTLIPLLLLSATASQAAPEASCQASATQAIALIELYTSEGCSSCPPADAWLENLGRKHPARARLVPLALHVPYWDYIGWRDRFASPRFEQRQRQAAAQQRSRTIYTPQVMFNGRDLPDWRQGGLEKALAKLASQAPRATLKLSAEAQAGAQQISLSGDAPAQAQIILVRYENGLSSDVKSGENSGVTLRHSYVVRDWIELGQSNAQGHFNFNYTLPARADIRHPNSGLAAFVQAADSGEILQAVQLEGCAN